MSQALLFLTGAEGNFFPQVLHSLFILYMQLAVI